MENESKKLSVYHEVLHNVSVLGTHGKKENVCKKYTSLGLN